MWWRLAVVVVIVVVASNHVDRCIGNIKFAESPEGIRRNWKCPGCLLMNFVIFCFEWSVGVEERSGCRNGFVMRIVGRELRIAFHHNRPPPPANPPNWLKLINDSYLRWSGFGGREAFECERVFCTCIWHFYLWLSIVCPIVFRCGYLR